MPPVLARNWPLAAALACAVLVIQPVFAGPALRYNDDVFRSAVAVFAILRSINAALSVAKETEVGFEFVGSVTAQPGMVLDPIDETVARVADAIFVLMVSSGVLKFALAPLAQIGAAAACIGFALLQASRADFGPAALTRAGRGLAAGGLIFALALPLGYGIGGQAAAWWTAAPLTEAQQSLQGSADGIEAAVESVAAGAAAEAEAAGEGGWFGWLSGPLEATGDAVRDSMPDMGKVQERGGEILVNSVQIIAIYALRLIVLPLLLIWAMVALARRILR